jgi:hypothetical protein
MLLSGFYDWGCSLWCSVLWYQRLLWWSLSLSSPETVVGSISKKKMTRVWLQVFLIPIQNRDNLSLDQFLIRNKLIQILFLGQVQPSLLPLNQNKPNPLITTQPNSRSARIMPKSSPGSSPCPLGQYISGPDQSRPDPVS